MSHLFEWKIHGVVHIVIYAKDFFSAVDFKSATWKKKELNASSLDKMCADSSPDRRGVDYPNVRQKRGEIHRSV